MYVYRSSTFSLDSPAGLKAMNTDMVESSSMHSVLCSVVEQGISPVLRPVTDRRQLARARRHTHPHLYFQNTKGYRKATASSSAMFLVDSSLQQRCIAAAGSRPGTSHPSFLYVVAPHRREVWFPVTSTCHDTLRGQPRTVTVRLRRRYPDPICTSLENPIVRQ